jgi:hypothetical protein
MTYSLGVPVGFHIILHQVLRRSKFSLIIVVKGVFNVEEKKSTGDGGSLKCDWCEAI